MFIIIIIIIIIDVVGLTVFIIISAKHFYFIHWKILNMGKVYMSSKLVRGEGLVWKCGEKILETIYSTFLPWCCLPFQHAF